MKHTKALLLSVFWLASQAVCAQSTPEQPVNLNQDLVLTQQQLRELAVEAMRGSSEAASKISALFLLEVDGLTGLNGSIP